LKFAKSASVFSSTAGFVHRIDKRAGSDHGEPKMEFCSTASQGLNGETHLDNITLK
jgi:hypothetical protein